MIGVREVVVGRQNGSESTASIVADAVEEAPARITRGPVLAHDDTAAIGEDEGAEIDRVAGGVLAPTPSLAAADPAATARAEMLERNHAAAEQVLSRGLHPLA